MDSDQSALTIAAGPQNNRAVHFSGGGGGGGGGVWTVAPA